MDWLNVTAICKYNFKNECLCIDNSTTKIGNMDIKEKGKCNKDNCPYYK